MIMKGSPGNDISDTELQQRHDLTNIISDWAVEGPYHRRAGGTHRHPSCQTGGHQL
jgi:hypothetical protein